MKFEDKLTQRIKELPELSYREELWESIASRLDFEKKLSNKLNELPEAEFRQNLWQQIEHKIDFSQVATEKHAIRRFAFYGGIAATILFLIGIVFFKNRENIKIESHEEYSFKENNLPPANQQVSAEETLRYIEKWCVKHNDLCNAPGFVEDKNQLLQIESEIKNINQVISRTGKSPALIKSLIKMENQKADIIKGLIKKMNS
jgi:hypothetical protein